MRIRLLGGSLLGLLMAAAPVQAWRTAEDLGDYGDGPVRWSHPDVTFQMAGELPSELAGADVRGAIERGLAIWAEPECSAVRPVLLSEPGETPDVTIRWLEAGWTSAGLSASAVGTTDLTYEMTDGRWEITSAVVLLNAEGFRWVVANRETASGEADVQAVSSSPKS